MASLPGMPGPLGLPAGNPQGSDAVDPNASSLASVIVNRTVVHFPPNTALTATIPATTEGNTLVVVALTAWFPTRAVFDGVCAGYETAFLHVNNDDDGYTGRDDLVPPFSDESSSNADISYWTNISGNITEVSWPGDYQAGTPAGGTGGMSCGPSPTIAVIYELLPSSIIDITSISDEPFHQTSAPDEIAYAVDGPDTNGVYICGIVQEGDSLGPPITGGFTEVSDPWTFDYQFTDSTNQVSVAVAIILGASGTQQATFKWAGSGDIGYTQATIALQSSVGTGGTPPPPDTDMFLPNTWVIS